MRAMACVVVNGSHVSIAKDSNSVADRFSLTMCRVIVCEDFISVPFLHPRPVGVHREQSPDD